MCLIIHCANKPIITSLRLVFVIGIYVPVLMMKKVARERVMAIPVDHFNVRLARHGTWPASHRSVPGVPNQV